MLSKVPPVPETNPSQAVSEEESTNKEEETNQVIQEGIGIAAVEGGENPQVENRVVEEAPLNANLRLEIADMGRQVQAAPPTAQVADSRGTDDRLFTWAAAGLTIAIIVLLLKKFIKASGYGAVFMDGS